MTLQAAISGADMTSYRQDVKKLDAKKLDSTTREERAGMRIVELVTFSGGWRGFGQMFWFKRQTRKYLQEAEDK